MNVPDGVVIVPGGANERSQAGVAAQSQPHALPSAPPSSKTEARARMLAALTIHCPGRCGNAIYMESDYNGCFALQCPYDGTNFCAWCLRPASEMEDNHTHVLDCSQSPEDMRGSALYLRERSGDPHVPPHPANKFHTHWRAVNRRRALDVLDEYARCEECTPSEMDELTAELEAQLEH